MARTDTSKSTGKSTTGDTLSMTTPNIFRETGRIDPRRLNQLAYAASHGIVDDAFAYNVDASKDEKEKEEKASTRHFQEMALESIAAAQHALAHQEPVIQHFSIKDDGFGGTYKDLTITNKNGDYLAGECLAPWSTRGAGASAATSFASESDRTATAPKAEDESWFAGAKKKIGGYADNLSSMFSGANKGPQISAKPAAPTPLGVGEYEPETPTLGYGA
jgi:hypothetical protein